MHRRSAIDVMRLMLRIEMNGARDRFVRARLAELQAETEHAGAIAAFAVEGTGAAAGDYARWLPAAHSRLARARQAEAAAQALLAPALRDIARAEAREKLLSSEMMRLTLLNRSSKLAKEQRLLEETTPSCFSDPEV